MDALQVLENAVGYMSERVSAMYIEARRKQTTGVPLSSANL